MPAEHYLKMTIPELVEALGSHAVPDSMRAKEIEAALQVKIAEEQGRPTRRANLALAISAVSALAAAASVVVAVATA
jgi:hypothetical protein